LIQVVIVMEIANRARQVKVGLFQNLAMGIATVFGIRLITTKIRVHVSAIQIGLVVALTDFKAQDD
jgi:hypothetical protein